METTVNKSNGFKSVKLIATASIFGCIGLICIILHVSPVKIFQELADFAAHHYFLAGFIFLVICMATLKLYYKQNESEEFNKIPVKISRAAKRRALLANFKKQIGISSHFDESKYVKKEKVTSLRFSTEEILSTQSERESRNDNLQKAMTLGNLYKQKVIICFKDNESSKHTLATVWHADENHVCLKGGATIPVQRIYKVEI